MFDHKQFSKYMKIALGDYLSGEKVDLETLENWILKLQSFNPKSLISDNEKMAFWINVYNGLTNYFIISHKLKKSVWEVENFFAVLKVRIGESDFSLDDIEHGILRKNGKRKVGKPLQFESTDSRLEMMVNNFDFRIHFALNCGSVSCPPVAFYSAENIDQELAIAEESFASQEFLVDHDNKTVRCSEIFIWYRNDFGEHYLNAPELSSYDLDPIPYQWVIH